ncbi:MAG: DUF3489 domain-containing protein [Sphingomonadaceae bacterium]
MATKLSDIQILLLTTASTREDGSVLPPSDLLGELSVRVRKAIDGLLRRGLVEEIPAGSPEQVWRNEGGQQIGLGITQAGKAQISSPPADSMPETVASAPPVLITKISSVLSLLQRQEGATLDEIVAATGWLPHTTRAALTGLRKKGHLIAKERRNDVTCYRVGKAG